MNKQLTLSSPQYDMCGVMGVVNDVMWPWKLYKKYH